MLAGLQKYYVLKSYWWMSISGLALIPVFLLYYWLSDALQARLGKRMEELKLEQQISPLPPVVLGGMLVRGKARHSPQRYQSCSGLARLSVYSVEAVIACIQRPLSSLSKQSA